MKDPQFDTTGKKFLRGYQLTDAQGEAKFLTIYPGWYYGRTVHIHIKVRATAGAKQTFEFTSQMYFEDSLRTASIPPLRTRRRANVLPAIKMIGSSGAAASISCWRRPKRPMAMPQPLLRACNFLRAKRTPSFITS